MNQVENPQNNVALAVTHIGPEIKYITHLKSIPREGSIASK